MHKIQCVSLPRSGHNLLVQHLQRYFQSNQICLPISKRPRSLFGKPRSQSFEDQVVAESQFHYCEYYYSCRKHPCENPINKFQKSHDFDLSLPVSPEQKYLIQFRVPLGLLISWFEMRLPRKREVDSSDGFIAFVERNREYLDGFRSKWIDSALPSRLLVDYDSYLEKPIDWLTRIVEFFDESVDADVGRITEIVRDVRPAKDNTQFRYYDAVAGLRLEQPLQSC